MASVDQTYEDAGKYWNVDPNVLRAVHQVEDPKNDPKARSRAGAIGHMQFMPETARSLGIDPTDPVQSIYGAARLLDENLKRYGNLPDALRAYNGGTDRTKWGNSETMAYPGKVAANYQPPQKQQKASADTDAFASTFGGSLGDTSPASVKQSSGNAFDVMFGHEDGESTAPKSELSRAEKAWTLVNDTVNSAGREIDRTFGVGVPHLVSWATSLGHHMDNPVSRAAHSVGDWVASKEDADEAARKNDYRASYTDAVGTLIGGLAAAGLGGRLIRPGAALLDGTRGGRIVANALTGDGPAAMKYANNALAGGVQAGLDGSDDPIHAAEVALGLGVLGHGTAKFLVPVAGKLKGAAGRVLNYLDPEGALSDAAHPTADAVNAPVAPRAAPQTAAQQKAEERAQTKAVSKIGAFSDPEKAAQSIVRAFTSKDGTRLYQAQVPGVFHTTSVRTQDAKMAGLENNLRDLYPDAFRTLDSANDHAYTQHLRETIGTPEQINNLEAERQAFEESQREAAFNGEQAVSAGALHDILDGHIEANRGNLAVKQAITKAKNALADVTEEDGTALPSHLWNVRKAIGYGLQQAAASESSHMRAAAANLNPFMDDLAHHIDQGAPGFHDYLDGYSSRSNAIDSQRLLQSRGLMEHSTNAPTGESVNYAALKKLIAQIDKNEVSVSKKGTDAVTPEQEARLRMVYRDMRAERTMRDAAGSSHGSNTFKNAMQQRQKEIRGGHFGGAASTLGGLLGAQEGGLMTGGVTGAALHAGNALLGHALANRRLTNMEQTDQAVINQLLGQSR